MQLPAYLVFPAPFCNLMYVLFIHACDEAQADTPDAAECKTGVMKRVSPQIGFEQLLRAIMHGAQSSEN